MKQPYRECNVLNKLSIPLSMLITVSIILISGKGVAAELPPLTHKLTTLKKVLKAPSLRLKNLDDEIIDIKDLKGKVVVVNFWATWCPPCRREMGSLERLHISTKDKNVVILAVNIGEDVDTVFSFLGQVEPSPTFPMLLDPSAKSMPLWKVRGLPTTYIISPNGTLVYRAIGGREFDHPDIEQAIINLNK